MHVVVHAFIVSVRFASNFGPLSCICLFAWFHSENFHVQHYYCAKSHVGGLFYIKNIAMIANEKVKINFDNCLLILKGNN